MANLNPFKNYLTSTDLSPKSVNAMVEGVKIYYKNFPRITNDNLTAYKKYLMSKYKPSTVNIRLIAMNKYLAFIKKDYRFKIIPNPTSKRLENIITKRQYNKLLEDLLRDGNEEGWIIIKTLAGTGCRPSEFVKLRVEHVHKGYADVYTKRNKLRRIYISKNLRNDLLDYIDKNKINGFIFTMTVDKLRYMLKKIGYKYGIPEPVMRPYSFRHFFGKQFISKKNDIALLADLMGHDSINTTRVYLTMSTEEQTNVVNRVIDWA